MRRDSFICMTGGISALMTSPIAARVEAPASAISLSTPSGSIAGTLVMPSSGRPSAVALIIAGSGPTDRDGNSTLLPAKNDAYKLLAVALAERLIASVRYDKRGVGASAFAAPPEANIRFETYVDDATAWTKLLKADSRFPHVIVVGHSEGSLIGMIAAREASADTFVSLEGAGRPAYVILREQLITKLPREQYTLADTIISKLQSGQTMSLPASAPSYMQSLFRDSVQPYLISWFKYDPAIELAKLRAQATIVQGTSDVQVLMADATALAKAKPDARLVIVDGMNHMLRYAPDTSSSKAIVAGYTTASLPIDPKVVQAIVTAVAS